MILNGASCLALLNAVQGFDRTLEKTESNCDEKERLASKMAWRFTDNRRKKKPLTFFLIPRSICRYSVLEFCAGFQLRVLTAARKKRKFFRKREKK